MMYIIIGTITWSLFYVVAWDIVGIAMQLVHRAHLMSEVKL